MEKIAEKEETMRAKVKREETGIRTKEFPDVVSVRESVRNGDISVRLSCLVMGAGNLRYGQYVKGILFLAAEVVYILFMVLFAQFSFVIPDHPLEMSIGYLSIICGAILWWFGLTWLIDKIRGQFDNKGIIIINKIIGCLVIIISLIILIGTVFNLYTFHY